MNETRRKPTTGRQSPTLFDKWHGIFYMPSRIDEAGHTKAFDYPVAEHWGESQRTKRSLVRFEPTSAHTYESEIQRSTTYATPTPPVPVPVLVARDVRTAAHILFSIASRNEIQNRTRPQGTTHSLIHSLRISLCLNHVNVVFTPFFKFKKISYTTLAIANQFPN